MRRSVITFLISSLILIGGCKESATNQQSSTTDQTVSVSPVPVSTNTNAGPTASVSPAAAKADIDPCQLLTSAEIQAVQGELVKETKSSQQASGGLRSLQCYYTLPTSSNSISLAVTETDTANTGGTTAKEFWRKTFGNRERTEKEREGRRDRDEEKEKAQTQNRTEKREEEEQAVPPKTVTGVGDEAFWTVSRFSGALYVLKGDRFIRLSVGGPGDDETKLKKSKQLAQKAIQRL